jgi:enoyl-CoA hydratase/carnithine racemase
MTSAKSPLRRRAWTPEVRRKDSKYGFTPGMGSTFILPKKLGIALAEESIALARDLGAN